MTQPPHSIDGAPGLAPMGQVLEIFRTMLAAQNTRDAAIARREEAAENRFLRAEERADQRAARIEKDIDGLREDVRALTADNARQDRTQAHDGRVAEEALTLSTEARAALAAEARSAGARSGGMWGALTAFAAAAAAVAAAGAPVMIEWLKTGAGR